VFHNLSECGTRFLRRATTVVRLFLCGLRPKRPGRPRDRETERRRRPLLRADKQTKDKQTNRKEERHRRSILLITNYSLLISERSEESLRSLWSLVGFEEILHFVQDDSWRVSIVVVVLLSLLSSCRLCKNDKRPKRRRRPLLQGDKQTNRRTDKQTNRQTDKKSASGALYY
jgi:hypothetical protein